MKREPKPTDEDILKDEYFHLQGAVEAFDQKALTIKAWGVTLSMAAMGAAYSESKPFILLLASLSSLLFWLIEARWKRFQHAHFLRIKEIEDYFSGVTNSVAPLQMSRTWNRNYHDGRPQRYKFLLFQHVYLPHSPVAFGSLVLFIVESLK